MHWITKIGIAAFVVATPIKWGANILADKTNFDPPSRSSLEARLRRSFVCGAHFNPSTIPYLDQKIVIREVWVERRTKLRYFLVWLPYYENKGSYELCFTLKEGGAIFAAPNAPFWAIGDEGHYFGTVTFSKHKYATIFYETLDALSSALKLSLLDSRSKPRPKDIEILIDHKP